MLHLQTDGRFVLKTMTKNQSKSLRISSIIKAAVEEFLEKGYSSTSMDAIASRAGISKGGLYHYFRNKDEILAYANQYFSEPVLAMLEELALGNSREASLKTFIASYISYWNSHRKELQFFFLSMNKAFNNQELMLVYQEYFHQELQIIAGVFGKGTEMGEFISVDAKQQALAMISALDGSLAYLLLDDQLQAEELISTFCNQFVTGILNDNHG